MRIQHILPLAYFSYPFLATQVFFNISGARRVVQLVPVRLRRSLPGFLALLPPPAALPLLGGASVQVLVFLGGRPVGEGAASWSWRASVSTTGIGTP